MTLTDDDLAASLDATARLLGVTIAPEWRTEVLVHMKIIGAAADLLLEFPLDEEIVPAPVFVP